MAATMTGATTWVFKAEARRRLGVSHAKLGEMIAGGLLSTRQVAGGFVRVSSQDVDRLLAESTRPARAVAVSPPDQS